MTQRQATAGETFAAYAGRPIAAADILITIAIRRRLDAALTEFNDNYQTLIADVGDGAIGDKFYAEIFDGLEAQYDALDAATSETISALTVHLNAVGGVSGDHVVEQLGASMSEASDNIATTVITPLREQFETVMMYMMLLLNESPQMLALARALSPDDHGASIFLEQSQLQTLKTSVKSGMFSAVELNELVNEFRADLNTLSRKFCNPAIKHDIVTLARTSKLSHDQLTDALCSARDALETCSDDITARIDKQRQSITDDSVVSYYSELRAKTSMTLTDTLSLLSDAQRRVTDRLAVLTEHAHDVRSAYSRVFALVNMYRQSIELIENDRRVK